MKPPHWAPDKSCERGVGELLHNSSWGRLSVHMCRCELPVTQGKGVKKRLEEDVERNKKDKERDVFNFLWNP